MVQAVEEESLDFYYFFSLGCNSFGWLVAVMADHDHIVAVELEDSLKAFDIYHRLHTGCLRDVAAIRGHLQLICPMTYTYARISRRWLRRLMMMVTTRVMHWRVTNSTLYFLLWWIFSIHNFDLKRRVD